MHGFRPRTSGRIPAVFCTAAVMLAAGLLMSLWVAQKPSPAMAEEVHQVAVGEGPGQTVAAGRIGLLVAAHGSPSPTWNRMVTRLEGPVADQLRQVAGAEADRWMVKVCFLECEPSIGTVMAAMKQAGCEQVIAVPLFVAPSGHSQRDVPAALGLYTDPDLRKQLQEEGAKVSNTPLPVTLTGPLSTGRVLEQWVADQVREMSQEPAAEAVVILAHGDPGAAGQWEQLMRRVATYVCGRTGITYGDWAYVAVGQSYRTKGIEAIERAKRVRRRVLVIGLYVGLSAEVINKKWGGDSSWGEQVVFARQGLLPDNRVAAWIVDSAIAAVEAKTEQ